MMTWAIRKRQLDKKNPNQQQQTTTQKQKPKKASTKARQNNIMQAMEADVKAKLKKKKEDIATRFRPGTLAYHGCELFSTFQRHHLHEPQRARHDPQHNDFVQKLSRGDKINIQDILQYEHLTEEDILNSPHEWKFATILVANNHERLNITRLKAQLWAKENNTYVFK